MVEAAQCTSTTTPYFEDGIQPHLPPTFVNQLNTAFAPSTFARSVNVIYPWSSTHVTAARR